MFKFKPFIWSQEDDRKLGWGYSKGHLVVWLWKFGILLWGDEEQETAKDENEQ